MTPGSSEKWRGMPHDAFTLPEILISLAIGVILCLFLVAGTRGAILTAQSAHCAQNLHQIGVAFHLYASEHNDLINPSRQFMPNFWNGNVSERPWHERLCKIGPYSPNDYGLKYPEGFLCPSESRKFVYHHYAANPFIAGQEGSARYPFRRFASLKASLLNVILVTENDRPSDFTSSGTYYTAFRHRGKSNVLYADGHVVAKENAEAGSEGTEGIKNSDYLTGTLDP